MKTTATAAVALFGIDRAFRRFAPIQLEDAAVHCPIDRDPSAMTERPIFVGVGTEFAEHQRQRAHLPFVELDFGKRRNFEHCIVATEWLGESSH